MTKIEFVEQLPGDIEEKMRKDLVICELCWLLKSCYKYSDHDIYSVLQMLLNSEEIEFSNRALIMKAAILYKDKSGDFADHLIYTINKHAGCDCTNDCQSNV